MFHDASASSLPVQCNEETGDLYAVPEKNRKSKVSKNVQVLPLTDYHDAIIAMYAMSNRPRLGHEYDGDTT